MCRCPGERQAMERIQVSTPKEMKPMKKSKHEPRHNRDGPQVSPRIAGGDSEEELSAICEGKSMISGKYKF